LDEGLIMPSQVLEWTWLVLLIAITVVRKLHERAAGGNAGLRGTPPLEATLMIAWGFAAAVLPLVYVFSTWLQVADYPFEIAPELRILGVATFIAAIWLLHRSHADLGRSWSTDVRPNDEHRLVVDGAYRRVRHPMYAAHILWGVAQTLLFPNLLAGPVALILVIAVLSIRVPREERFLLKEFPDEYRQYMNSTGRIIPRF
jgi:protein-S-isoprenylcysteine O-methyltransferase Ste14